MEAQVQSQTTVTENSTISEAVVEAVADATGSSLFDVHPPLHWVIDLEALERLFQPGADGRVAFSYDGHRVVVHSDGQVYVRD